MTFTFVTYAISKGGLIIFSIWHVSSGSSRWFVMFHFWRTIGCKFNTLSYNPTHSGQPVAWLQTMANHHAWKLIPEPGTLEPQVKLCPSHCLSKLRCLWEDWGFHPLPCFRSCRFFKCSASAGIPEQIFQIRSIPMDFSRTNLTMKKTPGSSQKLQLASARIGGKRTLRSKEII